MAVSAAPYGRLAEDRRLFAMSLAALGGGCVMMLIPGIFLVLGFIFNRNSDLFNFFMSGAILSLGTIFVLWLGVYFGFRFMFFRDAIRIDGQLPAHAMPRVIEALGVVNGQPEWAIMLPARCTIGNFGKCWIEVYANGIQIWKGPEQTEPRWQFAYRDIAQVESVDMVSSGRGGDVHQYFVRIIAGSPPMAFLCGSHWRRNTDAPVLADKLQAHNVPTFPDEYAFL